MVNEHCVRSTKTIFRGLHSQLTDLVVEKSVQGDNILGQIEAHDRNAMLLPDHGGKSSYKYLSEDQKSKIREEIGREKHFPTAEKS